MRPAPRSVALSPRGSPCPPVVLRVLHDENLSPGHGPMILPPCHARQTAARSRSRPLRTGPAHAPHLPRV